MMAFLYKISIHPIIQHLKQLTLREHLSLVGQLVLVCIACLVVILTMKERKEGFVLNIFKKCFQIPIYFFKELYIKCTLDLILLCKSGYAYYRWGARVKKRKVPNHVTALSRKKFAIYLVATLFSSFFLGFLYEKYTHQAKPYLDAFHAICSIINYYLLAHKKREAWFFSLMGQIVYVYVCWSMKMFFIVKYLLYITLSTHSLYKWHKAYLRNKEKASELPATQPK